LFEGFFLGRRVLVTGVCGVKGTWLALMLLESGAEVVGLDLGLPAPDSNFFASGLDQRIKLVHGSVTDFALIRELVEDVDAIFHLAALALVHTANRDPLATYQSNTIGTATLLEAIRLASKPRRAVFVTTDKVYRPKAGEPWTETDPLGASGAYAVSKACAELIIADYHREYFQNAGHLIGIARAGNVLIGGDLYTTHRTGGAGRILADCFEALIHQRRPEIFSPSFTRPYTYGLDTLSGYMTLMAALDRPGIAGEAFNFGPSEPYGVMNSALATKICEAWGDDLMWQPGTRREEPFEYQSLALDKSSTKLHWRPAYTLDESIDSAVKWYKAWSEWRTQCQSGGMLPLNRTLIEEHRARAESLGVLWSLPSAMAVAANGHSC